MSASSDYHTTALKVLHQITAYLTSALTLFPAHPLAAPRFLRRSMRCSLSHLLTCAERIYGLSLAQGFRDEKSLANVIAKLNARPRGDAGGGTDWSSVSDEEWEQEAQDLRDLGDCWVMLLGEFSERVEGYKRSIMQ